MDYVARNMLGDRVLVLMCARLGELVERVVGEHVLFGLEQDGVLTRLDLQRLKEPHVRELAERVLGRPSVPPGLADWLFGESLGNPLFTVSLLDAVLDTGVDLEAPRLATIPRALSARVAERVQALGAHSLSVLELLVVVGRPIDLEELRQLHSSDASPTLSGAIGRLVEVRLVVVRDADGDPVYEVSHPLVQECIYASLDSARRRALHHRVGLTLTASNRLGEAARHHARAARHGDVEAVTVLVRALGESWARQTYAEAFVILGSLLDVLLSGDRRWVEVLDAMPPDAGWAASYNRIAFDISSGVAAFREIETVLLDEQHGIDSTVASRAPQRLTVVSSYLAGLLGWCLGEVDEAATRAERAADLYEQVDDSARARAARCDLAWFEGLAGRYAAQEGQTRQVLAAAEAADDHDDAFRAQLTLRCGRDTRQLRRRVVGVASPHPCKVCWEPESRCVRSGDRGAEFWRWPVSSTRPAACSTGPFRSRTRPTTSSPRRDLIAWEAGEFLTVAEEGPRWRRSGRRDRPGC